MIAVITFVLAAATVFATGGSAKRALCSRLRCSQWLFGLFVVQSIARSGFVSGRLPAGGAVVLWGGLCIALMIVLMRNRDAAGVPLIIGGIGANALVVLANGYMPVLTGGRSASGGGFYQVLGHADVLKWMADALPVPGGYLMSVGDALMMVGVAVFFAVAAAPDSQASILPAR